MNFLDVFEKIHRNFKVMIYPILFDLITLGLGVYLLKGFLGEPYFSSRLMFEMGMPSLSHLSNIPIFASTVEFLNIANNIPVLVWIVVIIMIAIRATLQGGYIHNIQAIVKGEEFHFSNFIDKGLKYSLQFILLEVVIYLLKFSLTGFLAIFFNIVGVVASLLFILAIRVVHIYLEYTIALDGLSMGRALKESREYFRRNRGQTIGLIVLMYFFTLGLSFVLHAYWSPLVLITFIVIYAYTMTVIQSLFMKAFNDAREQY